MWCYCGCDGLTMPQCTYRKWKTAFRNWYSLSNMLVPEIKLKASGLQDITQQTISSDLLPSPLYTIMCWVLKWKIDIFFLHNTPWLLFLQFYSQLYPTSSPIWIKPLAVSHQKINRLLRSNSKIKCNKTKRNKSEYKEKQTEEKDSKGIRNR